MIILIGGFLVSMIPAFAMYFWLKTKGGGASDIGFICVYPEPVWNDERVVSAGSVPAYLPGSGVCGRARKEPDAEEDAEQSGI